VKVVETKSKVVKLISEFKQEDLTHGLVPTMGALHKGHLALVETALAQNDVVVVSIFVNPTQFDKKEDLEKYPRELEKDIEALKTVSKNRIFVYAPLAEDIYDNNIQATSFDFDGLEHEMEGKYRNGHFDGVGSIVKKLLETVKPANAYFGEKDFQQLQIIKKLAQNHNIPVNIVGCKIYREDDGLAMSSRNVRLKPELRKAAPFIYKTLKTAKRQFGTKSATKITEWVREEFAKHGLLELEYFNITDVVTLRPIIRKSKKKKYRAFIAVYADNIRLIDNIALN
jgi:pantoate--beta-alanine ligase